MQQGKMFFFMGIIMATVQGSVMKFLISSFTMPYFESFVSVLQVDTLEE